MQVSLAFDAVLPDHAGEAGVGLHPECAEQGKDADQDQDEQALSRTADTETQDARQVDRLVVHCRACGPSNTPAGM